MIGVLVLIALSAGLGSSTPQELERRGMLWQAGAAYEELGDLAGQMRVTCRLLEEALYAGHPFRSARLIGRMEEMGAEETELGLWRARLAWVCGLEQMAKLQLQELSGSSWLGLRAAGLASMYSDLPEKAVEELTAAYAAAENQMQRYYASIDLTYAMLASGSPETALEAADSLSAAFPDDALVGVLRALCLHGAGRFTESMMMFDSLATDTTLGMGPRSMADCLQEELQ